MPDPSSPHNICSELRSKRLLLRVPREGDGTSMHEAVVETLSHLRAWPASLPWAMYEPSVAASEKYCRESAAAFLNRTVLPYLAFECSGKLVASTSLHAIDWTLLKFEVGFWVRSNHHHKGIAVEAVGELVRYAFEELGARRIEAFPDERNMASRAVCEAVGMSVESIFQNEHTSQDTEPYNTCVYAALR